jgi:translation initiation factor 2 subunit 1
MYSPRFPEVDEVVMVQVKSIAEMGAYVSLLEYNNIEGMILLSELSRRRIRSIGKLLKVGRQEPVMVLRVDKEKGYIDLSKRRVSPEDVEAAEAKYNKSKTVHSIMRHVAETESVNLEKLYERVGWPLYQKYGHAYEAFKLAVQEPSAVLDSLKYVDETGQETAALEPSVREALLKGIRRKMTPQPLKIRADVELTCFDFDGVLRIQEAMRSAMSVSTSEIQVKVMLVASPLYVVATSTLNKDDGLSLLEKAIGALSSIEGVRVTVKEAPRVVSAHDDRLLAKHLEELAAAENDEIENDIHGMGALPTP